MGIDWITLAYGVAGSLIATAIGSSIAYAWGKSKGMAEGEKDGYAQGQRETQERFQTSYRAAITLFSEEIERLVQSASRARKDEGLISSAQAIVSTRDAMRDSLTDLSKLLNTEIDSLKNTLSSARTAKTASGTYDQGWLGDLRLTIMTLSKTWPAKKPQIDVACKKLLAEMGLEKIFDGLSSRGGDSDRDHDLEDI